MKILDPCTGTGNFIVNLMRRIPERDAARRSIARTCSANEIMLLPYYIAALNIEHAYYELTGEYRAVRGAVLRGHAGYWRRVAQQKRRSLHDARANTERVEREKAAQITVIIGNPPYNVGQDNENDNNKNRQYTGDR